MANQQSFRMYADDYIRCPVCRVCITNKDDYRMTFDNRIVRNMAMTVHERCYGKTITDRRIAELDAEIQWRLYVRNGWIAFKKYPWTYIAQFLRDWWNN